MGQNYGYETLMTELPTYMKQVLRFSIKEVSGTSWTRAIAGLCSSQLLPISIDRMPAQYLRFINFSLCLFFYDCRPEQNGTLSALPYLAMWLFSMLISVVADWMIYSDRFNHTATRKVINSLGECRCFAILATQY